MRLDDESIEVSHSGSTGTTVPRPAESGPSSSPEVVAVDDLVTWLRAQLDEDERAAMAAAGTYGGDAVWRRDTIADPDYPADHVLVIFQRVIPAGLPGDDEAPLRVDELDHIADHDPARVLAEVDAKRRMLDWIDRTWSAATDADCFAVDRDQARRIMALPYVDREGYREEWRPE